MTSTISMELVKRKAYGFMKSIKEMPEKLWDSRASDSFGKDYNKLRALASQSAPHLEILLPPQVSFVEMAGGRLMTKEHMNEIHTFCCQIYELLDSPASEDASTLGPRD